MATTDQAIEELTERGFRLTLTFTDSLIRASWGHSRYRGGRMTIRRGSLPFNPAVAGPAIAEETHTLVLRVCRAARQREADAGDADPLYRSWSTAW